jgi:hypothetical protein
MYSLKMILFLLTVLGMYWHFNNWLIDKSIRDKVYQSAISRQRGYMSSRDKSYGCYMTVYI